MESLYILLPLSLILVILIIGVLWWSISSGQYDSLDRASIEILMDQDHEQEHLGQAATSDHDETPKAGVISSEKAGRSEPRK